VSARKLERPRGDGLLARHLAALGYVCGVLLPLILRTGRRPVIFSRWTGMGDIICTIPAARELRNRHPGATFIYNCHPDFAAVPRLAGVADRITGLAPMGTVGHWYRFLLAGFYHFAHGDDLPDSGSKEPMVVEFCRQFGLPVATEHPALASSAAVREKIKSLLASKNLAPDALVVLHPGPSWTVKEWPLEHWTQLVAALRERGFTNIAQLGVGRYMSFGQVAVEPIPGAVSLVDRLSIEECFAVIAQAKLLIGIDSGLLHIAACTRTPAIGIWGPTLPQFFYARESRRDFIQTRVECAGCEHQKPRKHWFTNCPYDIKCMKTIAMSEVLQLCEARLAPPARG
jgi:ADP-heptose:LPS heptosyltransferase